MGSGEDTKNEPVEQDTGNILSQLAKTKAAISLLRREYKLSGTYWRAWTDRKVDFRVINASNRFGL